MRRCVRIVCALMLIEMNPLLSAILTAFFVPISNCAIIRSSVSKSDDWKPFTNGHNLMDHLNDRGLSMEQKEEELRALLDHVLESGKYQIVRSSDIQNMVVQSRLSSADPGKKISRKCVFLAKTSMAMDINIASGFCFC